MVTMLPCQISVVKPMPLYSGLRPLKKIVRYPCHEHCDKTEFWDLLILCRRIWKKKLNNNTLYDVKDT